MKKIVLTLFLLFAVFSLGNIAPTNAVSGDSRASYVQAEILSRDVDELTKRIDELEKSIQRQSFIQLVEFDAEIVIPPDFDIKYVEFIYSTSEKVGVPSRIAFRLVYKESSFNKDVMSHKGAKGIMQLMPSTRKSYYKKLRIDTLNLDYLQEDIYIGLAYLKDLHDMWKERGNSTKNLWKLALAAYNAGPKPVMDYKGVPPYKETINFVEFINKPHSNPVFFANYSKKYKDEIKIRT